MTTAAAAPEEEALGTGGAGDAFSSALRKLALSFAALCLLGVAVSVELTRVHVFVHTDPSYHSICAVSEGLDCETVAASPYSIFAGLPVSVWGIAGYLALGVLALWGLVKGRLHASWPAGLLLVLTSFSVLTSAVLAFVSATRINSLCLFCMAAYGINLALLSLALLAWKRSRKSAADLLRADAMALRRRPRLASALLLAAATGVGALQLLIPSYWRTPGWSDLPRLPSGIDEHGHHWIGAQSPRLTITEFSDYQCPHCRAAHKAMRVLAAKHPDRIRLVHRNLPLDMACHPQIRRPFHARACLFAEAAECASQQGRYWEMNDALFSVQESIKSADVDPVELAVRLGLGRSSFKRCLESHAASERVAADVREALTRKLTGTPCFLVGERLFLGMIPEPELEQLLAVTR